jgi:hypothetical protein
MAGSGVGGSGVGFLCAGTKKVSTPERAPDARPHSRLAPADEKKVTISEIGQQKFLQAEETRSMDLASEIATRGDHARRTGGAPKAPEPAAPLAALAPPGETTARVAAHDFVVHRQAPPRYEVTQPGDAPTIPCANASHAAAALSDVIGVHVSMQQVYRICRGDAPRALADAMPAGAGVKRLTDEERATRGLMMFSRSVHA